MFITLYTVKIPTLNLMCCNGSGKYTVAKWRTILHTNFLWFELGYRGANV